MLITFSCHLLRWDLDWLRIFAESGFVVVDVNPGADPQTWPASYLEEDRVPSNLIA
jgi:hypothetical protein